MIRIDCLKALHGMLPADTLVVVTLGVTTDEFYDLGHREASMYLPAMGCNTPVGLGLAMALPQRRVLVLDSDGSLMMSLGILTTVAAQAPRNLGIIVFDNQCYELIGGSPTPSAAGADLTMIAKGAGIKDAATVEDLAGFRTAAQRALTAPGPVFVTARFQPSIQRVTPKTTDIFEDKYHFVRYIERSEGVEILTPAVRGRRDAQAWNPGAAKPSE